MTKWQLMMRVGTVAALAATVVAIGASEAKANVYGDYVCSVDYEPPGSTGAYGLYGRVALTVYSGAGCTGTYQGSFSICSRGFTSTACSNDYIYSEAALLATYQNLQRATDSDQKVSVVTAGSYFNTVLFYAN